MGRRGLPSPQNLVLSLWFLLNLLRTIVPMSYVVFVKITVYFLLPDERRENFK